jgi:hypothetical protein
MRATGHVNRRPEVMAVDPALITGIAALLAAISTGVFAAFERRDRKQQFSEAEQQWRRERRIQYLERLVDRRFESYPAVMRTLGGVRDVQDPAGHHYRDLERNRSSLLTAADELLGHLYGAPGLFMQYETRNQLLAAWFACHRFQQGDATLDDLRIAFFRARRRLREDLQIADEKERKTELERISEE